MLLETSGEVKFQVRPIEGGDNALAKIAPDKLILDSQQRLTSLTQAISLKSPVDTRTEKGKTIESIQIF